jgi:hypothetical protein
MTVAMPCTSRFIYQLYEESRLPWVYGGEYEGFSACVGRVVNAWMAVGLRVYFVFDGTFLCILIVATSDPSSAKVLPLS